MSNTTEKKGFTILEFAAENFRKLKAVTIKPAETGVTYVTGKNAAGKSTVLHGIMAILDKAALKKQGISTLLREGAERGFVKIDLGDLIAKLTITEKGEYLTVENKEGLRFSSPAAVMEKLRGAISFDPLAFARQDGKKQKDVLLGLVDVGIDLEAHDAERGSIFAKRTDVGRDRDNLAGKLADLPELPGDLPEEEIPLSSISGERRALQETLEANNRKRKEYSDATELYRSKRTHLEELQRRTEEIDAHIKALQEEKDVVIADATATAVKMQELAGIGKVLREEVDALKDPDFSVLDNRLEEVERTNTNIREARRRDEIRREHEAKVQEYESMTQKLKDLDKKKTDALTAAKFPVDGLGFNADGVTFNGLPLGDASDAEKLTVSVAIGMALNPDLRVLWFQHGEMLDSDHWAVIEKLSGEKGYQVWAEKMDESGKVGVYIEDGEVANG